MINFPVDTVYLESVDSTNSYLKRIIKENGLDAPMVVVTDNQLSGRGRLGRVWQSSPGESLCMSIALQNSYCEGFTLLVAVGVYEALKSICSENSLQIKWPNDIICGNKKLCGILCERVGAYTVIGIGVNVNNKIFDEEIAHKATSLRFLCGRCFDIKEIAKAVSESVFSVLSKSGGIFDKLHKETFESACANIGRCVAAEKFSGVAVGVDENGALLLDVQGETKKVTSGEVAMHGIY